MYYFNKDSAVKTKWGAGNFIVVKFGYNTSLTGDAFAYGNLKVSLDKTKASGSLAAATDNDFITLDSDMDGLFLISDKSQQNLKVRYCVDGVAYTEQTFDLSGLTLLTYTKAEEELTDLSTIGSREVEAPNFTVTNDTITLKSGTFTVSNDATLSKSLTINEGVSVTVASGKTLTVETGKTITNNGTIATATSLAGNGTLNVENGGTFKATADAANTLTGGSIVYKSGSNGYLWNTQEVKYIGGDGFYTMDSNAVITLTPIANDTPNMVISGGTVTVAKSVSVTGNQIAKIASDATLTVASSQTLAIANGSNVIVEGKLDASAGFTLNGTMSVESGAEYTGNNTFTGEGEITLKTGSKSYIKVGENSALWVGTSSDNEAMYQLTEGTITTKKIASGTLNMIVAGNVTVKGETQNAVSISKANGSAQYAKLASGTLTIPNGTTFAINADCTLEIADGATVSNAGTLTCNGNIDNSKAKSFDMSGGKLMLQGIEASSGMRKPTENEIDVNTFCTENATTSAEVLNALTKDITYSIPSIVTDGTTTTVTTKISGTVPNLKWTRGFNDQDYRYHTWALDFPQESAKTIISAKT